MTEDEAKTKWCPFSRQQAPFHTECAGNRKPDEGFNCIGSACMAWRIKNYELTANNQNVPHGYCGLAGK